MIKVWSKIKEKFKKKVKTHKEETLTMTKKWIGRLLSFGCLWITWSYILASYAAFNGNYTVCENLSRSVVQFVVATIMGYMLKSYFETHSEEYNKLARDINGVNDTGNVQQETYFEQTTEEFMTKETNESW